MELRNRFITAGLLLLLLSCGKDQGSDAYGQFESTRLTVSSEVGGKLLWLDAEEGSALKAGAEAALIDTVQIHLKKKELMLTMNAVRTNLDKLDAQAEVYASQLATARKELNRLQALHEDQAATQQQIDQALGQVDMLRKQINAVEVQKQSVNAEIATLGSRLEQVEDQLSRTHITNPMDGTVIRSFAEPGELILQGRPLYEIANLEELILKVYVSGAQLSLIQTGQQVEVLYDASSDSYATATGRIRWIASEAEFTPQMIQTKEERVTQMYAVEIEVPNPEGRMKIGMPGEVRFR